MKYGGFPNSGSSSRECKPKNMGILPRWKKPDRLSLEKTLFSNAAVYNTVVLHYIFRYIYEFLYHHRSPEEFLNYRKVKNPLFYHAKGKTGGDSPAIFHRVRFLYRRIYGSLRNRNQPWSARKKFKKIRSFLSFSIHRVTWFFFNLPSKHWKSFIPLIPMYRKP